MGHTKYSLLYDCLWLQENAQRYHRHEYPQPDVPRKTQQHHYLQKYLILASKVMKKVLTV